MVIGGREHRVAQHGWCILRTSGARTLALAASLNDAGLEAWTPLRTFKRLRSGKSSRIDGKRITVEVDAPILPSFVFARIAHLLDLEHASRDPRSRHPAFSVFHHAGRIPVIADRDVAGLQEAERAAAASIRDQREAETREEADRIRIAALKTERARMRAMKAAEAEQRKMLRAERRNFADGERVMVDDMPALMGMSGAVVSSDGRSAMVCFGGLLTMKIEAWQLSRDSVQDANIAA